MFPWASCHYSLVLSVPNKKRVLHNAHGHRVEIYQCLPRYALAACSHSLVLAAPKSKSVYVWLSVFCLRLFSPCWHSTRHPCLLELP